MQAQTGHSITFGTDDEETTMAGAKQTAARSADSGAAAGMCGQRGDSVSNDSRIDVDYLEAGSSGPVVILVHSSVSGARQWRRLMDDLKGQFRVRAVNLYGYGKTLAWPADKTQSLDDQARLVEAVLPADADEVYLVGHSFGGSVAMMAAARLSGRVAKLVLLETNPFLSARTIRPRRRIRRGHGIAQFHQGLRSARRMADRGRKVRRLLGGAGTWSEMSMDRRVAFSEALKPNYFEWDAVMNETTPVERWADLLPRETLLVCDPGTVLPIREITALLRRSHPGWADKELPGSGHMAPLTRLDPINPLVASFLSSQANNEGVIELGRRASAKSGLSQAAI
jgi:pimeloyl-ACP methyl ester carboxylesterase